MNRNIFTEADFLVAAATDIKLPCQLPTSRADEIPSTEKNTSTSTTLTIMYIDEPQSRVSLLFILSNQIDTPPSITSTLTMNNGELQQTVSQPYKD